jgi:hypothetical protein
VPDACYKYVNTKFITGNAAAQKTTIPSTDAVLSTGTITSLLIDAKDCFFDLGTAISNANTGAFATAIGSAGAAQTAFNAAISYSDGWALATSFTFPKAFTATACPAGG